MTDISQIPNPVIDTEEQTALRKVAFDLGSRYGIEYMRSRSDAGETTDELWKEAGKLGLLGVNLPEEYGGGGAGMTELAIVEEELSAAGAGLLMMVVSPAINGTIISRFGTEEQKKRWLPGIASGETITSFAITEPDAGSNSHAITTTARRDGSDFLLSGQKTYISGVDQADAILVVARLEGATSGKLQPALFMVPTDAPGLAKTHIPTEVRTPERQFQLYFDDVRLPAEALIGDGDTALLMLFAGLNPERIMASGMAVGTARFAMDRATKYANERQVWKTPIGAHQGVSHPLAQCKIELELARLMMRKAAALVDAGRDDLAGEAANMAKYASGEVSARTVDQAIQTLGGNGLSVEYGLAGMLAASRLPRIAPVSREMILNYVAQHSLGLPKSY
ncbi:acyl-CoA dehydrogenase family protein [Dietzia maris]|uniref:acyl-CoA dehydrogenase family protein n=1 Tax=Dietzia maris TaxID=37915 RepID=UPI00223B0940|nr:acyl-CoA dehydrogenase family protein [Dietzia maris]MCT1432880.1 acyl-CoA/acyl-ACP dehydrogenase [Dietzia maris]MCT1519984.1 acyl-CoA/acyl-ACP dehydrogenase [Dietzia maris]